MTEEKNLITLTVEHPDEALFRLSATFLENAERSSKITSSEKALATGEDLKEIKKLRKELEQKRTSITAPINKALKEINALFKPAKDWLSQAERLMKTKLLEYQTEQERIAQEAQRKADEEARKEREKLERKATIAGLVGMDNKAEELREEAQTQEAPVITSAAPKIEGVHTRVTWKAEIIDKLAFVKFVIDKRPDLLNLIKIDQAALNAQARSQKGELDMPGIKAVEEKNIVAGS